MNTEVIQAIFEKIKYPSIQYPEQVAQYLEFPTKAFFQPKYDGSNVAIWVHDGELIISSRRRAIADKTLFEGTLKALGEYVDLETLKRELEGRMIVLFGELFGSKNTPAGYHKDYPKPLDIVIFDVVDKGTTIFYPPITAKLTVEEIGLRFVETHNREVRDYEELIHYATKYSKYEGCVIKIFDLSKYRRGVLLMKWKPQEMMTREDELPFSEIAGVIAKAIQDKLITFDMKEKQKFRILRKLIEEEANKHGLRPPSNKNVIYRAYSIVKSRVLNPETIEKIIRRNY